VASYLHRTATTEYLCCVPTLEDFSGAGRVGLAGDKSTTFLLHSKFFLFFSCLVALFLLPLHQKYCITTFQNLVKTVKEQRKILNINDEKTILFILSAPIATM